MNIHDDIANELTENQSKIIRVLLENPLGLLSSELALKTAVSNKSATITPVVKNFLSKHKKKIIIEKEGAQSRWKIIDESEDFNRLLQEALQYLDDALSLLMYIKDHSCNDDLYSIAHPLEQIIYGALTITEAACLALLINPEDNL